MSLNYCKYKNGAYYLTGDEGSELGGVFPCRIDTDNYNKLLKIAHKNGILTFDISTVINFVINDYCKIKG